MKKKSPLDINKLFPKYINKNVFRFFVALMLILLLVVFVTNGYTLKFSYTECPKSDYGLKKCIVNQTFNPETLQYEYTYIEAGEYIGNKPNELGQKFNTLVLLLTLLAFLVNHAYYTIRTGKTKIPFNKKEWRRIYEKYFRDNP